MRNKRKMAEKPSSTTIHVTEDDYRKELHKGIPASEAVRPGKHVFKRSNRQIPQEAFERKNTKIKVNMYLDGDIVEFFKNRAAAPNAAPYQTQINAELRKVLDGNSPDNIDINRLVRNEKLIAAIAARVKALA